MTYIIAYDRVEDAKRRCPPDGKVIEFDPALFDGRRIQEIIEEVIQPDKEVIIRKKHKFNKGSYR